MKKIYVINGSGGAGKDTFVSFLKELNPKIENYSTVYLVKQIAASCGWLGGKGLKERKFLADLKTLLTDFNDLPYNDVCDEIYMLKEEDSGCEYLFIHCREPEEIQRFVNDFGVRTILIDRKTEKSYGNHADDNVLNYSYDYIIDNNGTLAELQLAAETFYENIMEK